MKWPRRSSVGRWERCEAGLARAAPGFRNGLAVAVSPCRTDRSPCCSCGRAPPGSRRARAIGISVVLHSSAQVAGAGVASASCSHSRERSPGSHDSQKSDHHWFLSPAAGGAVTAGVAFGFAQSGERATQSPREAPQARIGKRQTAVSLEPTLVKVYYLGDLMGVDLNKKPGPGAVEAANVAIHQSDRGHNCSRHVAHPWRGGRDRCRSWGRLGIGRREGAGTPLAQARRPGSLHVKPRRHCQALSQGARAGCDALEVPA